MFGSLSGHISGRLGQKILVEVGGVGYWVHTGAWQPSGEVTCYLHHQVREDINELFGFPDIESLSLFEQLISISGIGPKAGLAVLSLGDTSRIITAILHNDLTFLALAPGIGKRAAEKIVLELKNKLQLPTTESAILNVSEDLRAALEGLGYKAIEIQPFLAKLPPEFDTLNTQIRWVLQQLAG